MLNPIRRRITLATIALSAFAVLPAGGQVINEDLKFTATDAAESDLFGYSIAIDDGIIAVGAIQNDDNGNNSGSAYLFDASTGTELFKLLPKDGAMFDGFSVSIAIDNKIVAVGAWPDDDNGTDSGSVYLFDASTGAELFKLLPNDGRAGDRFGIAIDIDDGVIAVGAYKDDDNDRDSGSAYLFNANTGEQIFKLLPIDGDVDDRFGISIAIDNGIVVIGADEDDDNGRGSGSAYLFDAITGTEITKLLPNDGAAGDRFGVSVTIDNGVVAVGAKSDGNNSGSAYLFNANTGTQTTKLIPSDVVGGDEFGWSIAIDNNIIAVGTNSNESNSGSAYLFDANTGAQITKLISSDAAAGDKFGVSIAIENGIVVVGSYKDDDNGSDSGSAYMFTVPTPCPADINSDGTLNFFDVSAFITALANNDPIADFTNDGRWNFFDVSAFLQAFAAGCP
jgi:FG-GAP repeat protein